MRIAGSLRVRVTIVATVAVAVVLVAVAVALIVLQRDALLDSLDERLEARAEELVASPPDAATELDDVDLFVVLDDAGDVVVSNADDDELAALVALADRGDDGDGEVDGDAVRFAVDDDDGVVAVVAGERDDADASGDALRDLVLWLVPVAVVVLAVVVWVVVGRTLGPVERIRAEVDTIGLQQLHRRVPQPPGRDEISRLATTMNAMLDRLQASSDAQARFVADASHELRTPLARMRTELEVDELQPATADPAATRRSQLEEIERLQQLVADLLVLARADGGAPRHTAVVDLDDVVLDEAARRSSTAGRRIVTDDVAASRVDGVEPELRRVVANLLDNAVRHAVSTVTVSLHGGDGVTLHVDDDGAGVPPGQRDEVFERFVRLDAARTAESGGSGLGLAIVRDLVTRHGGSVTVTDAPSGGARFTVHLPSPSGR